ncbi:tetratricopeptide repeat protein [Nitzschia inconspicua]|uniref:Tetratricopeptide repeat protein n=1 Tax=Nitzschia inconspicua TaxID=303405 RepID=A0A9K3KG20_9STRA|nr:tetratricopeptide repeat protein [Nitzschia inconspicua]
MMPSSLIHTPTSVAAANQLSVDRQNTSMMLLSMGSDYLSQGKHEEAMSAFHAAYQALCTSPTAAVTPLGHAAFVTPSVNIPLATTNVELIRGQRKGLSTIARNSFATQRPLSPSMPSPSLSPFSSTNDTSVYTTNIILEDGANDVYLEDDDDSYIEVESIENEDKHTFSFTRQEYAFSDTPLVDTYHEDECDVGPRPFQTAFVPDDNLTDVDVLQLIICYNQGLVHHAKKECSQAFQLYQFITGTIRAILSVSRNSSFSPQTMVTLARLAMRAHNNMGQLEYAERSEEQARVQFETALGYARNVPDNTASNQLEIATVLSNWCRVQWMLGRVDETVYHALEEILRIRFNFLGWDDIDVASAHFNLGMAEYSRSCNEKALAHFMQYLQVSSHRLKSKKTVELDPIPGLIFVLLIKNDDKDDKMSQDLVWGLRTLQDKRQDLGPKNPEVASVLNFIGTLLFHQRELDHALLFFQEELRLEEQFVGVEEDVSVSVTCNNIGRILQELGRYPQAIYYYQRSLRHRYGDDFFGPTASCKDKTQSCNCGSNKDCRMADCVDEDDSVLSGEDEKIPSATMNLYSTVWYNLGLIHDKMGTFAEAIRAFRMSLKLRRAMLGRDHSDVACLLYNIGVLQMEQQLLNEATASFREALRIRRVAATGQLNDRHVVKTLQKLASLHKSKGNIKGALDACDDVMQVLKVSVDIEWSSRNKSMGMTLREIAELHHAQGNLGLALDRAVDSYSVLRAGHVGSSFTEDVSQDQASFLEQETVTLLLIGSLQHEGCAAEQARATFAEAARLLQSSLHPSLHDAACHPNAATLFPLLEVSALLASKHCAPEA